MSEALVKALAVACELTNTYLSEAAAEVMLEELKPYPEAHVVGALRKCCKELKSRLTLADVLSRLDDGRPGVEEAWGMLATILNNEDASIVWTEEMRLAYGAAAPLAEDPIAARMAFKERYPALVSEARDRRQPVHWSASLGFDPRQRELVLTEAVRRQRLSVEYAQRLLPQSQELCAVIDDLTRRIGGHDLPPMLTDH